MTAMMIDGGKRVAAGGTRLQWHTVPIADIDLIARNRFADVIWGNVEPLKCSAFLEEAACKQQALIHRNRLMIDDPAHFDFARNKWPKTMATAFHE